MRKISRWLKKLRKPATGAPQDLLTQPPAVPSPVDVQGQRREKYGLFPLYDQAGPEAFCVDIVAIHGLEGDWEYTWTDSGRLWLRDFVPQQFPTSRVWSFGYDSTILSKSVQDIDSAASALVDALMGERRSKHSKSQPIIFIAHSLGGIVMKRALILANERSDHWSNIPENTTGAMFFSVPHRGADKAYWASFASRLIGISTLGLRGNRSFTDALTRNSSEFSGISNAFIQPASKLKIIRTFYETNRMGNDAIVDKDSALLRITNEIPLPVQGANHREICKFDSAESQKYKPVRRALEEMIPESAGAYIIST